MSKIDNVGYYDKRTGEDLSKNIIDSIKKEEYANKIKQLCIIRKNDPEKLSLDDLIILMKLEKRPTVSASEIKLNFEDDGYFTCRRDLNLVLNLHIYTKAFLYSISHMITHDGRLKYGNNKIISSISELKTYINLSNGQWNRHIKPDIEKYNIIKKEKIDNKWCLLLNPIYATTTRKITETMFIAFHEELKSYLHPLEYLYLKKFHGIIL